MWELNIMEWGQDFWYTKVGHGPKLVGSHWPIAIENKGAYTLFLGY